MPIGLHNATGNFQLHLRVIQDLLERVEILGQLGVRHQSVDKGMALAAHHGPVGVQEELGWLAVDAWRQSLLQVGRVHVLGDQVVECQQLLSLAHVAPALLQLLLRALIVHNHVHGPDVRHSCFLRLAVLQEDQPEPTATEVLLNHRLVPLVVFHQHCQHNRTLLYGGLWRSQHTLPTELVHDAPDSVGVVVVIQDGARVRQDLIQHLPPCRGFFREGYLLGRVGHEGACESRGARHEVLLELEARTLCPQDACDELLQLLRVGICAELQRSTLCGRRLAGGLGSRGLGVACALDSQSSDLG
mmetsp:Transcript_79445/g.257269  ORF Transcript_79445/g.257269 Transcript_79445/m.257269 type:complete len:302 (+) Transcript_79445:214-1119(+)